MRAILNLHKQSISFKKGLTTTLPACGCSWLGGAEALELAAAQDFPPCLVMRQLLKHLPLTLSKQARSTATRLAPAPRTCRWGRHPYLSLPAWVAHSWDGRPPSCQVFASFNTDCLLMHTFEILCVSACTHPPLSEVFTSRSLPSSLLIWSPPPVRFTAEYDLLQS